MSAPSDRPQVKVDRATESEVTEALLGLGAILSALELLVVARAADDTVADKGPLHETIDGLIVAGRMLADDVGARVRPRR